MIKLSKVRDLTLIILAMLFLPHESRTLLFDTQPQDWYGEMRMRSDKGLFILAKNSSSDKISANMPGLDLHVVRHIGSDSFHQPKNTQEVLPLSYTLLGAPQDPGSARSVETAKGHAFTPSPLSVKTRADDYMAFSMILVVIIAFSTLAFLCAIYIGERGTLIRDTEEVSGQR